MAMLVMNSTSYTREVSGFTLIELMVTVAVVAIIAAIALPSYTNSIMRGKRSAAKSAMMDIANREQQFLLANRVYADKAALTNNGYALNGDVSQNYSWTVTANNAASPPTFLITLAPVGSQASDGSLTLDSIGNKSPPEKWSR